MVRTKTRRGGGGLHIQKKRKNRRGGRRLADAKVYAMRQKERTNNEVLKRMVILEQKIISYETDPILGGCSDPPQLLLDHYIAYENKSVTK